MAQASAIREASRLIQGHSLSHAEKRGLGQLIEKMSDQIIAGFDVQVLPVQRLDELPF